MYGNILKIKGINTNKIGIRKGVNSFGFHFYR